MSETNAFHEKLYSQDPYVNARMMPLEDFGWHHLDAIFERLIRNERPRTIIEVGTFKGGSALNMAHLSKVLGVHTPASPVTMFCIDTFLGAWGHWDLEQKEAHDLMGWESGRPTLYETFVSNVIRAGHEDIILPIAQTSANGARILKHHSVAADLVYIDGSHEFDEVWADLHDYWPLLKSGGIMFGDDYHETYPGVVVAVDEFRDRNNFSQDGFGIDGVKWFARKGVT